MKHSEAPAQAPFPSPEKPRVALLNPQVVRYFHHYITDIAPWYDLSDSSHLFGTKLPETALDNSLPFAAILALSAVHISRTTAPSAKPAAEFYHGHCVRILIDLKDEEEIEVDTQGLALASVCLLRSYEILSGTSISSQSALMKLTLSRGHRPKQAPTRCLLASSISNSSHRSFEPQSKDCRILELPPRGHHLQLVPAMPS